MLPFAALLYVIYYALPIFTLREYRFPGCGTVSRSPMLSSLVLSCLGLTALYVGYYARIVVSLARYVPHPGFNWSNLVALRRAGILLACVGILVRLLAFNYLTFTNEASNVSLQASMQQLFLWLANCSLIGLAILYSLNECNQLRVCAKLFFWGATAMALWLGFSTGSIYQGIQVGLLLLFLKSTLQRRMPWGLIVLGLTCFLILQPAKGLLRVTVNRYTTSRGPLWRASELAWLIEGIVVGREMVTPSVFDVGIGRLDCASMFACVVSQTPNPIPFWNGHSYYPLITKFVPRLLYPDKVAEDIGDSFPRRYGIVSVEDTTTDVNLPQLIEGFVNFGWIGVVMAMGAIGAVYRLAQAALIWPGMEIGDIIVGAFIFSPWLNIESNASLVLGGFPYQLLYASLIGVVISLMGKVGA